MSEFRTTVPVASAPFPIEHQTRMLLAGSCFTTHIGERLAARKFEVRANPFGVIYNPVSLANSVWPKPLFHENDFFQHQGLWRHWDLHSDLAHPILEQAQIQANAAASQTRHCIQTTDVLLLTLGTADVFYLLENEKIVANCHKMPAAGFGQKRLSVAETTEVLQQLVAQIRTVQPMLHVVLTVSPVRHWRNGAIENQRSKSVLLLACEALCKALPDVYYFPAYELLMDDLRDYRFYASDMLHPSDMAIAYIWEKFESTFFSPKTVDLCRQIEKISAAAAHRPFNPDTPQHRAFQEKQLAAIASIEAMFPALNWEAEKQVFQNMR